jgi:hypothetical protein
MGELDVADVAFGILIVGAITFLIVVSIVQARTPSPWISMGGGSYYRPVEGGIIVKTENGELFSSPSTIFVPTKEDK